MSESHISGTGPKGSAPVHQDLPKFEPGLASLGFDQNDVSTTVCELCGGPVLGRHCKITCLNCGFQRDCSDP